MNVYVHLNWYIYTYNSVYMHVASLTVGYFRVPSMYICMYVFVRMYVYMYVCMYGCMFECIYVCTYIYKCVHV